MTDRNRVSSFDQYHAASNVRAILSYRGDSLSPRSMSEIAAIAEQHGTLEYAELQQHREYLTELANALEEQVGQLRAVIAKL